MGEKDPFEEAYRAKARRQAPPWDVGHPQEVVVRLERAGLIEGPVLDAGCGTGEHTLLLAALGYDVLGIDSSPAAISEARAKAEERGIAATFELGDALRLGGRGEGYATVVDTGLFHLFDGEARARYTAALHRACRPGARVHVLSLSDTPTEGFPPGAGQADYRTAFGDGWHVEEIQAAPFTCLDPRDPLREVDVPGWLARVRRS
ncbi:class I SAM-dependent methyltransferase [Nonomuraea jabiensis]|uniref:SAM-dependent methyltransferase n=1 Tax=Nonomuraea jabiensis TaxID=882448 RepID=A0A7W9LGS3_9ACTN|nr:class I SAM-dependent methyltransferase [Nonomuraea jabiensis]MBB5783222.1 SAM-dependent methyltransferase [Nonomuraea jabiensis]